MVILWVLVFFVFLLFGIDRYLRYVYRIKKSPHTKTPQDYGISFREVQIPVGNHHLYGWWIPADSSNSHSRTIIMVHGWGRNVQRMMPYIKAFHPEGYNILVFDLRGHGSSDSFGELTIRDFSEDIRAVIDFFVTGLNGKEANLTLLGLSVGGASSIYAASQDERIGCVVTVGAPSHPIKVMQAQLEKNHIPYIPVGWLFFRVLQFRLNLSFNSIAPENNIRKSNARFLLIHGEDDAVVPISQAETLLKNARPGSATIWRIRGKAHSDCHYEPGYWEKVDRFIRECSSSGNESP